MTILRNRALISAGLYALLLFASCKKEAGKPAHQNVAAGTPANKPSAVKTYTAGGLYFAFLWRDKGEIVIPNDFAKKMSAPEKAALGYVATFIGSDCNWDGPYTDKRDNLKCRVLTALDLGYQCSDKHLGFLRHWFRKDTVALKALENCPTVPYTATSQETFDHIAIRTTGNLIQVLYNVSGINMREQETWSWHSKDSFKFDDNSIKLIKQEKSEVKREHLEVGE
jgi:hypothetical protein